MSPACPLVITTSSAGNQIYMSVCLCVCVCMCVRVGECMGHNTWSLGESRMRGDCSQIINNNNNNNHDHNHNHNYHNKSKHLVFGRVENARRPLVDNVRSDDVLAVACVSVFIFISRSFINTWKFICQFILRGQRLIGMHLHWPAFHPTQRNRQKIDGLSGAPHTTGM
jgi:hypothetical protein